MSPTISAAAAASAAVSCAARFGISCQEPVVLSDGANVIVHLSPAPVVAKVAASTLALRDPDTWLQRDLDVASFLAAEGAPVIPPSPEMPPRPQHADGQVMSFWRYVQPADGGRPPEATIGAMLTDLHAVLRRYQGAAPALAPLGDIPAFLARPESRISDEDAAALQAAYARLTAELDATSPACQPLHGDAGAGNIMASGAGWVWHDFEDVCSGPVAYDLAPHAASKFLDGSLVIAAYRDTVDPRQLSICRQLRLLHLTVWYNLYAERLPECRERAAELLASWPAPWRRPIAKPAAAG